MLKEVLIEIKSTQETENDRAVVEMTTVGQLGFEDGCYTIIYNESEDSGMQGSITTLKVSGENSVVLSRRGAYNSHMIIEKGARHLCHYETPYGGIMMGVSAEYITSTLNGGGGNLSFKYDVDINSSLATRNEIDILIKESKNTNVKNS